MNGSSKYWTLCRINPASGKTGYEMAQIPSAQEFAQQQFSNLSNYQNRDIQMALLSDFRSDRVGFDTRGLAGLCLRCNVSYSILRACQKIYTLFGSGKSFTYGDLLPFVLNDDGKTLIVLDKDGKTQLRLDRHGNPIESAYKFFAVEILRTYGSKSQSNMSLDNWAYLQTKQNQDLKDFLSEFGFKALSDWALLNRTRPKQLESLSQRDRSLVEVFHGVYRRDRQKHPRPGARKCPDPSTAQLEEMLAHLQQREIVINTTVELFKELKQVATQLRQYDIWSHREPLETYDPETGSSDLRRDLPTDFSNEVDDLEQREFLQFLHQQLRLALTQGIEQEMERSITKLKKSRKYASLAQQFIPGLRLYYCEGMSFSEIAPKLGMTSRDQTRRVLNPGELIGKVRTLCVQQLIESMLDFARKKGLTSIPPSPDYLQTLAEQIEAFSDREIFTEAAAEIKAGKNRSLNSLYAQQLRIYLEQKQL